MTIVVLGGDYAEGEADWVELLRERAAVAGVGPVMDLRAPAGGGIAAIGALGAARLAYDLGKDDLILWDLAENLRRQVVDDGADLEEALRPVEMLLRIGVRNRIAVAALLSERCDAARDHTPDPLRAALTHLFERYATPTLSLSAELRRRLRVGALGPEHFAPKGTFYRPSLAVQTALGDGIGAFVSAHATRPRPPISPTDSIFGKSIGAVRLALPAHAAGGEGAAIGRLDLGVLETDVFEIAPGGYVEFPVEGELLGLAAMVGPDEGAISLGEREDAPKKLARSAFSLRASKASLGETVFPLTAGAPMLRAGSVIRVSNVAHRFGEFRARAATFSGGKPAEDGPVRLLAVISRLPGKQVKAAREEAEHEALVESEPSDYAEDAAEIR